MRRWFSFRRDLGLQLFALYLLLIIPFLITLLVFNWLIGVRIRDDVQASDLSLAQSISQEVDISIAKALSTYRVCQLIRGSSMPTLRKWKMYSMLFSTLHLMLI